jgi:hypothetical protein
MFLSNIPRPGSLSSSLMTEVTLYRNVPSVFNKIQAQLGYALVFLSSVVESAVAIVFSIISLLALPVSREPTKRCLNWLSSSAFTIGWSFVDFFLNPFMAVVVADEKSARQIVRSGNLLMYPREAIL